MSKARREKKKQQRAEMKARIDAWINNSDNWIRGLYAMQEESEVVRLKNHGGGVVEVLRDNLEVKDGVAYMKNVPIDVRAEPVHPVLQVKTFISDANRHGVMIDGMGVYQRSGNKGIDKGGNE